MRIRYKQYYTTLNYLCDIRIDDFCLSQERKKEIIRDFGPEFNSRDYYSIKFIYLIKSDNEHLVRTWRFDTKEERDKVHNIIMNNYFTDIERLTNDNN